MLCCWRKKDEEMFGSRKCNKFLLTPVCPQRDDIGLPLQFWLMEWLPLFSQHPLWALLPWRSMANMNLYSNRPLGWGRPSLANQLAKPVSTNRLAAEGSLIHQLQHRGEYGVGLCVFTRVWMWVCLKTSSAGMWKKKTCRSKYTCGCVARAYMRVWVRERGKKKATDSAILPPPTRLAAKTRTWEFV